MSMAIGVRSASTAPVSSAMARRCRIGDMAKASRAPRPITSAPRRRSSRTASPYSCGPAKSYSLSGRTPGGPLFIGASVIRTTTGSASRRKHPPPMPPRGHPAEASIHGRSPSPVATW